MDSLVPIKKLPFFLVPRFYSNPDENVPFGSKAKEAFYIETSMPINDSEFMKVLEANGNMNEELEKWVRTVAKIIADLKICTENPRI